MPTTSELELMVQRYAAAVNTHDPDSYSLLFAEDAVQSDPYPTPPNVGREAIRTAILATLDSVETVTFETIEVYPGGDKVAFSFLSTLVRNSSVKAEVRGIMIFTVSEDCLISRVEAFWSR
jgi:hypothetical protein